MDIDNFSIGTDIEEVSRFEGKSPENDKAFLDKIFTQKEIDYSFKSQNSAQHLCVRFCAKEAVVKALSSLKIKDVFYSDIEILNQDDGTPFAVISKYPDLKIKISLSHCKNYANAVAFINK